MKRLFVSKHIIMILRYQTYFVEHTNPSQNDIIRILLHVDEYPVGQRGVWEDPRLDSMLPLCLQLWII
jgi:hypothetical protein